MLKNVPAILPPELLKVICEMGHSDRLVISDGNFPVPTKGKNAVIVRMDGHGVPEILDAILQLFPLDTYVDTPAYVMDLTDSDKAKGMPEPVIWGEYAKATGAKLGLIERFAFYERTKNAYLVIQTGEERQYGNLLLTKGVVL